MIALIPQIFAFSKRFSFGKSNQQNQRFFLFAFYNCELFL